ncbi:MAG TPA: aminotransferase class V-fold PLP-dependent enzyme [Actinomycetes bacterium]|nr:aminotransferase class V-fold PLP-dependent enzyme [Actinomycetes bacterium]
MHQYDADTERLAQQVIDYARNRLRLDPVPLDGPRPPADLAKDAGQTITPEGLGGDEALRVFQEVLAKATLSVDNPRYLSFIPAAPTEASTLFDLVVGASSIYGGSWLEGAGAIYAENQALRWVADLAGLPPEAGGVFVQGGTLGNLSALVAARHTATTNRSGERPARWAFVCSSEAHSSMQHAARVMDVDIVPVPVDASGRMTGDALHAALDQHDADNIFAVVATGGTTNYGVVDDIAGVVAVARERSLWVHVDGAYGLAALCAPSARDLFVGIEHVDSLIVDPHKWFFAPFDACALIYRDPRLAKAAHTQTAGYLEAINNDAEWNPSDYAVHLSRRARGLPFWFSLATHGTNAYSEAVEQTLMVAQAAAEGVRARSYLELVREPNLSVVVFRRLGWTSKQYYEWSDRLLAANFAFVLPTTHNGETVTRFAIVNPRTTVADVHLILDTMAG